MNHPISRRVGVCVLLWLCCLQGVMSETPRYWPAWTAPTVDGKEFASKNLEGKVVVVSVWASWCSSCRRQIPLLSSLQRAHPSSGLQVVSFSLDRTEAKHQSFLAEQDVSFPAIFARSGPGLNAVRLLQKQAGPLEAVPTLMVFDQEGRLVHRSVGYASLDKLEGIVEPLLDRASTGSL